jgi:predicted histidine transporter YuiF (NhaC family)
MKKVKGSTMIVGLIAYVVMGLWILYSLLTTEKYTLEERVIPAMICMVISLIVYGYCDICRRISEVRDLVDKRK